MPIKKGTFGSTKYTVGLANSIKRTAKTPSKKSSKKSKR